MTKGEPLLILYIEDDPAHAEIAMRNLKKSRFANQIVHLTDGQQAVDYLFRKGSYSEPAASPRPHLILLDLRLPKIDGLEVLKILKEDTSLSSIPVVILTTSNAETDIAKAYDHHVNSYLVKPLDFENFSNLLESLGFYWLAWNTYPN